MTAQGIEAEGRNTEGGSVHESPVDKVDAPPSLPPTGEGLPEEIVDAINALTNAHEEAAADSEGLAIPRTTRIDEAYDILTSTILHHLSAARAERDQALVDLSIAQGPDPEQAFDEIGMASRQTTLGKHKAANYAHIRKVIGDLDAAGMTEAADTLLWAHWWRQNERSWTKYMRESCLTQQRAAEDERDAALARAERAEKALEPFARYADVYDCYGDDYTPEAMLLLIENTIEPDPYNFTVADLRRARAVLSPVAEEA